MIDYTKIPEYNKMIAQFMGYSYHPYNNKEQIMGGYWHYSMDESQMSINNFKLKSNLYLCRHHKDLRYFNEWNWLIPVVEKIENLDLKEYFYSWEDYDGDRRYNFTGLSIEIEDVRVWPYINFELDPCSLIIGESCIVGKNKREAVYEAVVEIILWHNELINRNAKESKL